ncbi:MAG: FGGY-family carbohydrate kinase [Arenicella sp.]|nr:FGGY-family carbohydrate kinase [Arenicella sp.]
MSGPYILAVDAGSQSTKVSIFDTQGRVHAHASVALQPLLHHPDGRVEHPGDDLWDSLINACQSALSQFDGKPSEIVGIGLCTIRCCRAVLGKDGRLAAPVMSWMDVRLGVPYQDTDDDIHYVTTSSGYISHRMTGRFKDTASNYEGQWPIDKLTWDWSDDEQVITEFHVPRSKLFQLVKPGDQLGLLTEEASRVLGLKPNTPVIATANDKAVEALGAGLNTDDPDDSSCLISLGTYIGGMRTIGGMRSKSDVESDADGVELRLDSEHFFCNMASQPNGYLYESGGIRFGMSMVSWFRGLLNDGRTESDHLITDTQLNDEATQLPVGSEGLITVPEYLASTSKPYQRGCLIGLTAKHERAHVFRSILESIAMTMVNHVNAMNESLSEPCSKVIVSGGGSKSDLLMQIFADLFNTNVVRPINSDAAGLGAAICASVALGLHDSFASAQEQMVRYGDVFQPNALHAHQYQRLNDVFKTATRHTDPLLSDLYRVTQSFNATKP